MTIIRLFIPSQASIAFYKSSSLVSLCAACVPRNTQYYSLLVIPSYHAQTGQSEIQDWSGASQYAVFEGRNGQLRKNQSGIVSCIPCFGIGHVFPCSVAKEMSEANRAQLHRQRKGQNNKKRAPASNMKFISCCRLLFSVHGQSNVFFHR